jgi:hypothetical protein
VEQGIDIVPSTRSTEPEEDVVDTTRHVKQPLDVFLVLDVEATCLQGELYIEMIRTSSPSIRVNLCQVPDFIGHLR